MRQLQVRLILWIQSTINYRLDGFCGIYRLHVRWILLSLSITDYLDTADTVHNMFVGYCGLDNRLNGYCGIDYRLYLLLPVGYCGIHRLQTHCLLWKLSITDSLDTVESFIIDLLYTAESIDYGRIAESTDYRLVGYYSISLQQACWIMQNLSTTDKLDAVESIICRLDGYCGVNRLQTHWMLWDLSITNSLDTIDCRFVGYCDIYRLQTPWLLRHLPITESLDTVVSSLTDLLDTAKYIDYIVWILRHLSNYIIGYCRIY